ncbi:hypothetical protein [Acaricomes phytoseiuli]|uniref:hypothetical protein n=1 Tax=Acaricomes phytoseiuli TaxID=291968 RepID=UPI0012E9F0C9|nr:hypothetical protein [Acaricomes phytoseiuli]
MAAFVTCPLWFPGCGWGSDLVGVLVGFAVFWVFRADAAVFCGDWSCFPGPGFLLVLFLLLSSSLVLW